MKKEESELEKIEKIRTEIQKALKKPWVILVILAIVIFLIIFSKMQNNQAGEEPSVPEISQESRTEASVPEDSQESRTETSVPEGSQESRTETSVPEDSQESRTEASVPEDSDQSRTEVTESSPTPDDVAADGSDTRTKTFDLGHAIAVGEGIHLPENGNLEWQGEIVHHKGGTLGAYEEAVNIFNGTHYHIYEVYNVLVSAHPELKTKHIEPYACEDINHYYGFTVSRAPAEINEIDNALREGKLVQLQVHSNKWRNANGELVDWPGYHSGLIFYFDGSLYHMKAAGKINQMNAVYTREQLIDWIGGTSKRLVIYTKNSPE